MTIFAITYWAFGVYLTYRILRYACGQQRREYFKKYHITFNQNL